MTVTKVLVFTPLYGIETMCYNNLIAHANGRKMLVTSAPVLTKRRVNLQMATSHSNLRQMPLPIEGETFTIYLTQGQSTVVDAIDADLDRFMWQAYFDDGYTGGGKYVARRSSWIGKNKRANQFLHRVILSRVMNRPLLREELVDHIDTNPLNNRRDNLRLATTSQNAMNKGKPVTNTSGFKGAHYHKLSRVWEAAITVNGKQKHLGSFGTAEEAYEAYCKAAKQYFGEFARLE